MSEIEKLESELDAVIEAGRKAVIGFRKMVADRDAEIASLRAEIASLRTSGNDLIQVAVGYQDEIVRLRAELEASRKDASFQCERAADKDCIIESIRAELAQWTNTANLAGGVVHSLRAELTAQKAEQKYLMGLAAADAEALRAELADESPGTPLGRLSAIAAAAKERGLCTGVEAKPAEVFLIEALDALRAEVAAEREKAHYANGVADLAIKHRDVAEAAARQDVERARLDAFNLNQHEMVVRDLHAKRRQDTEEIARLTGLLERWMRHADIGDLWRDAAGHYLGETMVAQDTRAALVRTPTGLPVGVQQEEIARLMEALKPFAEEMYDEQGREFPWFAGMDDSSAAFTAWGVHCDLVAGDFRRAALACTPTVMPSGVQQTKEIARLREALEPFAASAGRYEKCSDNRQLIHAWNSGETLTVGDLRRSRAALACRPQGEKS